MFKSSLSVTTFLLSSLIPLTPAVSWGQTEPNQAVSFPKFICQTEQNPPITIAIMEGEKEVIATWYSDYLLPNDSPEKICKEVAQKLQQRYDKQQSSFFAYEPIKAEKRWEVCLVSHQGKTCLDEGSESLFSLNDNKFKNPTECVLKNTPPNRCRPITRGSVLSVPGGKGYSPRWFNQLFGGW